MNRPILAIASPNHNVYSETFIQAHRNLINADIKYFFGGHLPRNLETDGFLMNSGFQHLIPQRLRRRLFYPHLTIEQVSFMDALKQQQVQVMLAEYGVTGAAVLPVCRQLSIPLIVHFHGYDAAITDVLRSHKKSYGELFDYATAIIAVSRSMENKLLTLGCPKEKLVYNVYGPNEEFFAVPSASRRQRLFIGVGRFVEKKAPYLTLLAFKKVLQRFPDAKLLLAGDGPLWATCKDLVNYFRMHDCVSLPGSLTSDQVRQHFAESIALIQHSVTPPNGDMEGTPVVILEASAASLPVIATRHAGIPDVIVHGETGLLVEERDVDGMADHMCYLLEQPDRARAMGEAGRRRIRRYFTMDHHIQVLDKLIWEAAGKSDCLSSAGWSDPT